jgi:hypothetical protein
MVAREQKESSGHGRAHDKSAGLAIKPWLASPSSWLSAFLQPPA